MALAAVAVAGQSASGAVTTKKTFTKPGSHSWTVPAGVTKVTFTAFGASGGNAVDNNVLLAGGGVGGETQATFAVSPGMVFQIDVAARGADGAGLAPGAGGRYGGGPGGAGTTVTGAYGGGGGGGSSDVRLGGSGTGCAVTMSCDAYDSIVVAGGGGGASADTGTAGNGGAGGGLVGANGENDSDGYYGDGARYDSSGFVLYAAPGQFGQAGDGTEFHLP